MEFGIGPREEQDHVPEGRLGAVWGWDTAVLSSHVTGDYVRGPNAEETKAEGYLNGKMPIL
jgi:hypothetical protein